jgi:glucose-6-phosphate isomerase
VSARSSEARPLTLDVNGFFDHMVGEAGFAGSDVDALARRVGAALKDLAVRREAGELAFYKLPYDDAAILGAEALAAELRERFHTLVVLGIGGSALGTKAAVEACEPTVPDGLRVEVLDNVDPSTVTRVMDSLDLETTAFNVISKSGTTAETMAQYLIVRERLLATVGAPRYREHVIVTTDPEDGCLRDIATDEGFRTLPVPPGVGGRFSVLSPVGLLPIAAAGVDIAALCEGARMMDVRTSLPDVWANPAALHATLLYLAFTKRHANVHVLMPYSDGLLRFAEWYGQLWAESLGKRHHLDGSLAETGQTPVRALGTTDQHSQVQLYVEGPHDKVVTFIRVRRHRGDLPIPSAYADIDALAYLGGHTLGELLNMEQRATELALADAERLTSVIELSEVDAPALGQLFHMFEVQTLVMGALLSIDPLDQPGVEAGKKMTQAMAGRPGYEQISAGVQKRLAGKHKNLVLS